MKLLEKNFFDSRVQTAEVRPAEKWLGYLLGPAGAWGIRNQYGTETKFYAQLELTYEDGRVEIIATDETWRWSNDGPIRLADNKDGEVVEAYRRVSYAGKAKLTSHHIVPSASNNVANKENEVFQPKLINSPKGKKILDFGQNFAGYVSFSIYAEHGDKIILRFREMLLADGEFTQRKFQLKTKKKTTPLQRVDYTCKEGKNNYKSRFQKILEVLRFILILNRRAGLIVLIHF